MIVSQYYIQLIYIQSILNTMKLQQTSKQMRQSDFMRIKQKIDQYRLPTTFSIDSIDLISKLFQKLEEAQMLNNKNHQNSHLSMKDKDGNMISEDERVQIRSLIEKNNQLMAENYSLKQEISAFPQKINLIKGWNSKDNRQFNHLRHQFQQLRYRYNEIIDMVHGQDVEKKYIKRLIKQKHVGKWEKRDEGKDKLQVKEVELKSEIEELKTKLINRQIQIQRLRSLCEGSQIVDHQVKRMLTQRKEQLQKQHMNSLQLQIDFLMEENETLKSLTKRRQHSIKQAKSPFDQYGIQAIKQSLKNKIKIDSCNSSKSIKKSASSVIQISSLNKESKQQSSNRNNEKVGDKHRKIILTQQSQIRMFKAEIKKLTQKIEELEFMNNDQYGFTQSKIQKLVQENEEKDRVIKKLQKELKELKNERLDTITIQAKGQQRQHSKELNRKITLKQEKRCLSKEELLFETAILQKANQQQKSQNQQQVILGDEVKLTNLTAKQEQSFDNEQLQSQKKELQKINRVMEEKMRQMERQLQIQALEMKQFYSIYEQK